MKKKWLTSIGIMLIIWEIIDIAYNMPNSNWYHLFWFSRNVFFLVGLALIIKDKRFAGGVFLAVVGAEIFWALDFFMMLAGYQFMNTTRYILEYNWIGIIFQMGHVVIIPLAIFMVYHIRMKKDSYLVSWVIAGLFLFLGRLGPASANVNCAYGYCGMGIAANSYLYLGLFMILLMIYPYVLNNYLCRFTRICK